MYGDFRSLVENDLGLQNSQAQLSVKMSPHEEAAVINIEEIRSNFVQVSILAHTIAGIGGTTSVRVVIEGDHEQYLTIANKDGL